jgi:hydroxymethylpyrimidine pyrophosphatase-like HAD family hydrolase
MTRLLLAERFDIDLASDASSVVFAGDSPNDAPMFAFFESSVGVANVRRFESRLAHLPKYVTKAASGAGFAELAAHLLANGPAVR